MRQETSPLVQGKVSHKILCNGEIIVIFFFIQKFFFFKVLYGKIYDIRSHKKKYIYIYIYIDDAKKITSEPHGPHVLLTRTCTIQKLKTLRGVPVWYQPNTLRRSS